MSRCCRSWCRHTTRPATCRDSSSRSWRHCAASPLSKSSASTTRSRDSTHRRTAGAAARKCRNCGSCVTPRAADRAPRSAPACAPRAGPGSRRSTATARTTRPTSRAAARARCRRSRGSSCSRAGACKRRDSGSKRWASRWANAIRARLLHDDTPDTGCGIKLFERAAFLELPYFDHMHRYLPALMQRAGWKTVSVPVNHRPRVGRRVQVRQPRPRAGRHRRPARRGLADPAREAAPRSRSV